MQNHVIDPTFFYDVIEEFAFNFNIYVVDKKTVSDSGKIKTEYTKQTIRGSLQSKGTTLIQKNNGNTNTMTYMFYCKSLYRINIGDIIEYKGNYLMCDSVRDYDEYGVRSAHLQMITLTAYRDLKDYIDYIEGRKIV